MADLTFLGSPPTDKEWEDWLDADHDAKARERLVRAAIRYMEQGKPVPRIFLPHLKARLRFDQQPAGVQPKASLLRVGEMIESLIGAGGFSETQARKRAAEAFEISQSTATNYHREYVKARKGEA